MIDPLDGLEQRLIVGYNQQASYYEHALLCLAGRAPDAKGAAETGRVADLLKALEVIAKLDADLVADKIAWRQSGRTPGDELRMVLERVATQIRVLAEHVDALVADAVAQKQRLVPEVDDFIRQRWMLNAYERHGQPAKA
jgi:hypothetical protein